MTTIAFCTWPWTGAISGTLTLASRLRERGHEVCIISIPDAEDAVVSAGLRFEPILADLLPTGTLPRIQKQLAQLHGIALFREIRRQVRHWKEISHSLLSGTDQDLDRVLHAVKPDLLLVNSDIPILAIIALAAGKHDIPLAYVTPLFNHHFDPANPPLSSHMVPREGILGAMKVRLAWLRYGLEKRFRYSAVVALGLDLDMRPVLRALTRLGGTSKPGIRWRHFLAPNVSLPEFFISAEQLDLNVPLGAKHHRVGFSINSNRAPVSFPWERLDKTRKLLYCSLGTLLFMPLEKQVKVLQTIVDAAAKRPEWQLVIATGAYIPTEKLNLCAPDAIAVTHAPQLELLKRASLMITHCGVNTLHECAYFGVPMVALPITFDQPGNAIRMELHGLGVRGQVWPTTVTSIGRLIDDASDPALVRRCADFADTIRDCDFQEAGLSALEALAGAS